MGHGSPAAHGRLGGEHDREHRAGAHRRAAAVRAQGHDAARLRVRPGQAEAGQDGWRLTPATLAMADDGIVDKAIAVDEPAGGAKAVEVEAEAHVAPTEVPLPRNYTALMLA